MKHFIFIISTFLFIACGETQQTAAPLTTPSATNTPSLEKTDETAPTPVDVPKEKPIATAVNSTSTKSETETKVDNISLPVLRTAIIEKAKTTPTAITNIKTSSTRVSQDIRLTTSGSNYVSWVGGTDDTSGILKYVIFQYALGDCAGNFSEIETQNQYLSFNADLNSTYSFKIKAINNDALETISSCSGNITRISTQTNISNATITINAGDLYTRSTTVTLTLAATNATELYITNDEGCNTGGSWESYKTNKSWVLSNSNATSTVYIKYRDTYGRESDCISDSIIHDSLAPTNPSLAISSNYLGSDAQGRYVINTNITANISAVNANQVYISNTSCDANGSWEQYTTSKAWTLGQTNGTSTVYAKFRDIAGNESNCVSDSIRHIDTAAPTGLAVKINWNGAYWGDVNATVPKFTSTLNATISVYAADDELTHVAISNGTECNGSWEPFISNLNPSYEDKVFQRQWTLVGNSGVTYVSAKVKDASGNTSGCVTTSIKLVAMDNVADVYTGFYHTCIKSTSGKVKCWGRNDYAQLGYGFAESTDNASAIGKTSATTGINSTAIDVGTNRTVVSMALGFRHSCALLDTGIVKCWGSNNDGQLGLGHTDNVVTTGDSLQAVNLGGTVVEIAAGQNHTCARLSTGEVKCWGANTYGQLGIGSTENVGNTANPVFTSVDLGTGKTAIQITANGFSSCALLNDHTAKCWGNNTQDQLGQDNNNFTGDHTGCIGNKPNQLGDNLPAIRVRTGTTVNQIVMGSTHACALLDDGGVTCWGSNILSSLSYTNRPYMNIGPAYKSVTQIAAYGDNVCEVTPFGAKCWGGNNASQIGQGSSNFLWKPTVPTDENFPYINYGDNKVVSKISSGFSHSCALFTDHTVKCWGENGHGQLGLGHTNNTGDNLFEMGNFLPEL
jgi:alpha-tubulin suppressor-like RCC1 family protein